MDSLLNDGNDESKFELLVTKFIKHLLTPNMAKICSIT